jgi:hypothetical protein
MENLSGLDRGEELWLQIPGYRDLDEGDTGTELFTTHCS